MNLSLIVERMQKALEMAGGSVGLTALFLCGIIALWYNKKERKNVTSFLFWYALITLIVVISPVFILFVIEYLPELYGNNVFLWILPNVPVMLYTGMIAVSYAREKMGKLWLTIGFLSIIILAAFTSYSQTRVSMTGNSTYIEKDMEELFGYITERLDTLEKDSCLIWGGNDVMESARIYDGRIHTLYGKDYWESGAANAKVAVPGYEDLRHEYEIMQNPAIHMSEISVVALAKGCDYIVVPEAMFEEAGRVIPENVGSYYWEYTDNNYLVYVYSKY